MSNQGKGTMSIRISPETRTLIDMVITRHRRKTNENLTIDEAIRMTILSSRPDIVQELERMDEEVNAIPDITSLQND